MVVATYLVATAVEKLERQRTATPPLRLPMRGKDLMKKPEGLESAIVM